ncbi:hypothetical protein [Thorsellia kenyensis]|uniref:Uncharacterized protein n=1 Tax=Thorsellia kenyensis TaxID=1549888 RepID=A0ABV6CCV8_9GAMM
MKLHEIFKLKDLVFSLNGRHFQEKEVFLAELETNQPDHDIKFYCGQKTQISHIDMIDPYKVITCIRDDAFDLPTLGSMDERNLYLDDITEALEQELATVIADFFNRKIKQPTFSGVKDIIQLKIVNSN